MKVGFTSTREGLTREQHAALVKLLKDLAMTEWHFGCCIGGDEEAADIVFGFDPRPKMVGHPPTNTKLMSSWPHYAEITMLPPEPYLVRNTIIVHDTDVLVGCPRGDGVEELRSGTWQTIRYAKKVYKPVIIVFPNGTIERWEKPNG